jgi:hypothetical protein
MSRAFVIVPTPGLQGWRYKRLVDRTRRDTGFGRGVMGKKGYFWLFWMVRPASSELISTEYLCADLVWDQRKVRGRS